MKFRFIEKNRSAFPVKNMCQALKLSRVFSAVGRNPVSKRKRENIRIKERVRETFNAHKGMAGSPLDAADLQDEREFSSMSLALRV